VLALLDTLPEETCKVILNTDRRGHWSVEVFTRYTIEEETLPVRPKRFIELEKCASEKE
jgi:hypothetical protein